MSLHSAWRAALGRPEPRQRSRCHLQGKELQMFSTESSLLQVGQRHASVGLQRRGTLTHSYVFMTP